ncbi:MAG: phosphocholine cytidylyltransferase family protein [Chlamydiales bacterium]|nr:phosphocholine cytidylyltransferase family protein [Chlamydiia bacterium]MCP5507512.1 phosphocholine cytidylyltransferase family protein [Chlamydiales bacterium]
MKAIILAAGMGSRLGNGDTPKPMTLLSNGKSILQQQLENLSAYVNEIVVVVGYRKELIEEAYPHLVYVENPQFAEENTSKSLLRALEKVQGDVMWLNGDVVFRSEILKKVVSCDGSGMVVNVGQVGDEEVKYRTDERGLIVEVSKRVREAEGEALGINIFRSGDLDCLREALSECSAGDYFEKGVQSCIDRGVAVTALEVGLDECCEVDFPEDLERANALISQWVS